MTTRCKIHHGGGGGVCAPCLRERLLALSAAQNEASPGHHRHPPLPLPPPLDPSPLALPRSVSPYVPRRRSDAARRNPSFLFFRSPQVGPSGVGDDGVWIGEPEKKRKGIGGVRFSILSTLFGHSGSAAESCKLSRSRSRSKSWLSALVHVARRKKPPETGSPAPGRARRSLPVRDRGMSPEEEEEEDGDDDDYGDGASGCSRESPWLHPTPSPMRRGPRHRGGGGGVSGFAVCLSPLVRPSPSRRRSRWSRGAELDFSGDLRCRAASPPPRHPHHHRRCYGGAAALGHCRSRKLGELGRFR